MGNRSSLVNPANTVVIFYSDFTMNLDVSAMTGQLALLINENDVISSMKRLVLLSPFEREYQNIGGGIDKLLFEPMDGVTTLALQNNITDTIKNYEQRASLESVIVTPDVVNDQYIITIVFSMINNTAPITFEMILARIR